MNRTARNGSKTLWALALCVGSACGGRAVTVDEGGSATAGTATNSGAAAGTVAVGGTSGGTGNVGKAGSASGGTSSAGASNTCPKSCPPISCDSSSKLVFPNGACCPSCISICPPCPTIACPSGYQLQTQPGECCPICVPSGIDCATGQKVYSTQEAQFADKYKTGCTSAADCITDMPSNACESGCAFYPISQSSLGNWQMNLASEAARDCSSCPPSPPLPCAPPPPATCVNNQCQIAVFL